MSQMGVKEFQVSNRCKIFQLLNGCKNILCVKLVYKYLKSQFNVKKFYVSNRCKNIIDVNWE